MLSSFIIEGVEGPCVLGSASRVESLKRIASYVFSRSVIIEKDFAFLLVFELRQQLTIR